MHLLEDGPPLGDWQVSWSLASSLHLMGPCWVAGTTAAAAVEAPELPSLSAGAASDPEGTFTPATWVDLGRESSSGGLERQSATTLSAPATWRKSEVNSAT